MKLFFFSGNDYTTHGNKKCPNFLCMYSALKTRICPISRQVHEKVNKEK